MKIALCISGLVGGLKGKSQDKMGDSQESLKISSTSIKKHIIEKNNVDIFIHSWELELQNLIIKTYKPKNYKFEQQIIFNIPNHLPNNLRIQSHYSRWYSNTQVMLLKNEYEKENSFLYDAVIVLRFDSVWYTDVIFSELNMNKINLGMEILKNGKQFGWPNNGPEVLDHCIVSNNTNMNIFYVNIFENLNDYTQPGQCPSWQHISHHYLIVWHLRKLGLLNLIDFPFIHYNHKADISNPFDYTLVRHYEEVEEYNRRK